jgi:Tfp pilus assembly protein PilO
MNKVSRREHLLLIAAMTVAVAMGYVLVRYIPLNKKIAALKAQQESKERQLKSVQWPKEPVKIKQAIEEEITAVRAETEGLAAELEGLDRQLVPVNAMERMRGLEVEISTLARKHGVLIIERAPYEIESTDKKRPLFVFAQEQRRVLQRIQLEAPYHGVRGFLEELGKLPWQVTVLQFELSRKNQSEQLVYGPQRLQADLVIAL